MYLLAISSSYPSELHGSTLGCFWGEKQRVMERCTWQRKSNNIRMSIVRVSGMSLFLSVFLDPFPFPPPLSLYFCHNSSPSPIPSPIPSSRWCISVSGLLPIYSFFFFSPFFSSCQVTWIMQKILEVWGYSLNHSEPFVWCICRAR